ncbi:hypothetical protein [Methylobacterium dankookense]|uniref:Uncharacterized protein n=1 Tax=Methylobacterium dankookense TaxID=560405 RepID=A0A564G238_9HYPH|nr:hypothetical protein [Methylobacterium dankookense]GJD58826.1 hypothetical protein IFDJLNFL_4752 [Methylobacterium dankookense]VUF14202.1 hypothetical protein MTDSW087_03918 [Methylobacterium dankookense]
MTDANGEPNKLAEVLRLATLVAERVLEAQLIERPVPSDQFNALVSAVRLLQDQNVPLPPLVEQVVSELSKRLSQVEAAPDDSSSEPEAEHDSVIAGLTRFLGAFRRE